MITKLEYHIITCLLYSTIYIKYENNNFNTVINNMITVTSLKFGFCFVAFFLPLDYIL